MGCLTAKLVSRSPLLPVPLSSLAALCSSALRSIRFCWSTTARSQETVLEPPPLSTQRVLPGPLPGHTQTHALRWLDELCATGLSPACSSPPSAVPRLRLCLESWARTQLPAVGQHSWQRLLCLWGARVLVQAGRAVAGLLHRSPGCRGWQSCADKAALGAWLSAPAAKSALNPLMVPFTPGHGPDTAPWTHHKVLGRQRVPSPALLHTVSC